MNSLRYVIATTILSLRILRRPRAEVIELLNARVEALGHPGSFVEILGRLYEEDHRYRDAIRVYTGYMRDFRLRGKATWSPFILPIAMRCSECLELVGEPRSARQALVDLLVILPKLLDDGYKYRLGRLHFMASNMEGSIRDLEEICEPRVRRQAVDILLQCYLYTDDLYNAERIVSESENLDRGQIAVHRLSHSAGIDESDPLYPYELYLRGEYEKSLEAIYEVRKSGEIDRILIATEILAHCRLRQYDEARDVISDLRSL